jgi:hypothetical protein
MTSLRTNLKRRQSHSAADGGRDEPELRQLLEGNDASTLLIFAQERGQTIVVEAAFGAEERLSTLASVRVLLLKCLYRVISVSGLWSAAESGGYVHLDTLCTWTVVIDA